MEFCELIIGSMFSGKTSELIRRVKRLILSGRNVVVFQHSINKRDGSNIETRDGIRINGIIVSSSEEIDLNISQRLAKNEKIYAVGIDEIQFFDNGIINVIKKHNIKNKIKFLIAGIDSDFKGRLFPVFYELIPYCDSLTKLTSICVVCGSEYGCRNQRVRDNSPVIDGEIIECDSGTNYQPRCLKCFVENMEIN
ncbi:MAG: hypothetical protein QXG00_08425 [Candidatus Woesearchaeota archaeon]